MLHSLRVLQRRSVGSSDRIAGQQNILCDDLRMDHRLSHLPNTTADRPIYHFLLNFRPQDCDVMREGVDDGDCEREELRLEPLAFYS